jgi:uncharacterized protein (TIGR03084 family)
VSGADLDALESHLNDETEALRGALARAGASGFAAVTPSPGWSVADQVSHLAYFDDAARTSVLDPEGFAVFRDEASRLGVGLCDDIASRYRTHSPVALLSWWREARGTMLDAMHAAGTSARVPWYGPTYSVASALTGRIMETWAHGQDVYEALGEDHPVTPALFDVARLCARTRANSYAAHGRVAPEREVAVELEAPDGTTWRFGDAGELVRGDAVEFCLVATQRRHHADTSIVASGPDAAEWLALAQAFAGPPGDGRPPRVATP